MESRIVDCSAFACMRAICPSTGARSVTQAPAAPGRRSIHCHTPAPGSLLSACRRCKASTRADFSWLYKMAALELTEGMRVYFNDGGPIYLCVGRDETNFYFQGENGIQNFIMLISIGVRMVFPGEKVIALRRPDGRITSGKNSVNFRPVLEFRAFLHFLASDRNDVK